MTRGASRTKELFAAGHIPQLGSIRIVVTVLGRLPVGQPVAQLIGQHIRVFHGRAPHPSARGLIADDHAHVVVVRAILNFLNVEPKLPAQLDDIFFLPAQKRPVGAESVLVLFQNLRRIRFGIDRDGVEEDILAQPIPQKALNLQQLRSFKGAGVRARRVNKIDGHHFVFDQVIKEADLFTILGHERYVGEIFASPGRCTRRGHPHENRGQGQE